MPALVPFSYLNLAAVHPAVNHVRPHPRPDTSQDVVNTQIRSLHSRGTAVAGLKSTPCPESPQRHLAMFTTGESSDRGSSVNALQSLLPNHLFPSTSSRKPKPV